MLVFVLLGVVVGFVFRWWVTLLLTFVSAFRFLPKDLYHYLKDKGWTVWNGFGLRIYVGLFGTGKTLSAVRYVTRNASRYNLNVLSNIHLDGVPYVPLVNYNQIIDAPGNTIILIDEVSTVFNSRAWKDFNVNLLFQLLQCRKQRKQLVCTAQRFAHVDKLIRDITAEVIVCRKWWRVCTNTAYDGWDFENSLAQFAIPEIWKMAYVATDGLYASYDTDELIDNAKRAKFVSNEETLAARGVVEKVPENMSRKGKRLYGGR